MTKQDSKRQLALNLRLKDDTSFENFYGDENQKAKKFLMALDKKSHNNFIYFWGETPGVGKTHLGIAACQYLNKLGLPVFYLSLKNFKETSPEILENLDKMTFVCIDDLDVIIGQKDWEEALMNLFNHLVETRNNLLVTANKAPAALNFALKDLQSRFMSCLIFRLHPLTDEQKLSALNLRAKDRGITLPKDTAQFLLNHNKRDLKTLFSILEKLSEAALRSKRALTIPFVKEILAENTVFTNHS